MRFATTFEYRQWYLGGKAKTDAVTDFHDLYLRNLREIGRASCRERV